MPHPESDAGDLPRILVWNAASPSQPAWRRTIAPGGRCFELLDLGGGNEGPLAEAAPTSDLAVLVIEADEGIDPAMAHRIALLKLLGLQHLGLAVRAHSKNPGEFAGIADAFDRIAQPLGFATALAIPLATETGEGDPADMLGDPAFLALLERVPIAREGARPFRLTVDNAPGGTMVRGTVVSGQVAPGDALVAAGSGRGARVLSVTAAGAETARAFAGAAIALRLDTALDAQAGEVLATAADRPESCDQFAARILWLDGEPLLPGRSYRLRLGTREVPASVTRLKHRIEAGNAAPLAAGTLRAGDEGRVNLSLTEPVVFEPFERNRALGTFTLVEPVSERTVAAGRIDFALRRAANIHRQAVDVTKAVRAAAKAQRPVLLWFTGLSGSGKSTIANLVEKRLFALGHHTYLLDGDNVRHGLNRDLGFTAEDRVENIRRVAETAKLMVDAGLITLASFISPFRAERKLARDLLAAGEFVEVFVDAPLAIAEARDPKGLYAQARAGRIPNFTGIDSPYEAPEAPELHLQTDRRSAEALADEVVAHLDRAGFLAPPDA